LWQEQRRESSTFLAHEVRLTRQHSIAEMSHPHWLPNSRKAPLSPAKCKIQRSPFKGIGKPEPLKHALAGYWSRRITDEHRIVYKVERDSLLIAQLRFHY